MKRRIKSTFLVGFFVIVMSFLAAGCKKEEKTAGTPVQEAWTVYQTENVTAYTLDEEGNLYTFEWVRSENESEFCLRKHDTKGNQLFSRRLEEQLASYTQTMTVKDGVLYFAPNLSEENKRCAVLYSYQLETEEFTKIKAFPYFEQVKRILVGEDRIYLLGGKKSGGGMRSDSYTYAGEKVMCYTPSTGELSEILIPEPIDISLDEEGNLFLYAHTEEGFCFLLYDETRDAIKTIAKTGVYKMCNVVLCNNGEDVIYQAGSRGLVLSSLSDLEVESELYPKGYFWDNNLCYVNGRVACSTFSGSLVQFRLEDVKKENKRIRYISTGYELAEPYGCGYEMQRTKLAEDKFALKIMALDKDFDLCLVDTAYSFSYNLKENGMFYPLNDVPGVQEYLDTCFPYVREAATDEDGNIWMLPIGVSIQGIVVGEKAGKERSLLENDRTYEEYFHAHAVLPAEERKVTDVPWAYMREFFRQYFAENTSVDTAQFRNIMRLLAEYFEYSVENSIADDIESSCEYVIYENNYHFYYITQMGENAKVYGVPKLSTEGKNVGTCLFLAVNPYSDNLNATLNYISDWIAYTMKREDAPLFFANRTVDDTVYETSLYELYQKGEIGFTLDEDIYEGYDEVLENITKLEDYIAETERKLKIYLNE